MPREPVTYDCGGCDTVTAGVEPGYYGPTPAVRCEHGHPNGDLFPGYEREWES